MIKLSPGLAQGCFELLGIATHHRLSFAQIRSSFAYLGSLPCSNVVETAQALNWLHSDDEGCAALTPSGSRLLTLIGYETKLRQALLDYIDIERPAWIQNAAFGRSRVLAFAGSEISQVFVEANLAGGVTEEIVAFWDALAARARGQRNESLNRIGRIGERLTLNHEEFRTGRKPKWIAIDNNADGYDVLSIVDSSDLRNLSIEVKASTLGKFGKFHLSRNEWERAKDADLHVFHLWDISSKASPSLAKISFELIDCHTPKDQGSGAWENVEIPFSAFIDHFTVQPASLLVA